jgi:hypothetical protein
MSNRLGFPLLTTLLALLTVSSAHGATLLKILYQEKIELRRSTVAGSPQHLSFDAYGRRFDLLLERNPRIMRAVPPGMDSIEPLQGTVEGASGSWVRLTGGRSGWRGVFFDGSDLFAIEPAADIADATVQPLAASGSTPVIYRLSDALLPVGAGFCEVVTPDGAVTTPDGKVTAAAVFKALAAQLSTGELATLKQVRVGIVADQEFAHAFSGAVTPEEAIVARMNIVDGIFSTQVGVKIELAPPTIFRQNPEPFTRSKASDLLTEVRDYRRATPQQLALGLTHLMTGRTLDGATVGIAYIGTVCDGEDAASLSEATRSTTTAALIAAHEIGHNFNAPHDGEAGSACASTPQTFLMAPHLNGSDHFSACSLQQMQPVVRNASCLSAYTPPDAAIVVAAGALQASVNTPFTASFSVHASGDDASQDVAATATLPADLSLQSADTAGATCTSGAGTVSCALGTLMPGETRQIDLNMVGATAGTSTVNLSLASSNDSVASNNSGTITVTVAATPSPPSGGSAIAGGATSGASGGGGRLDFAFLALLLALLARQHTGGGGAVLREYD